MADRFVDTVAHEIAEEKAGSLGRAGVRLMHALERFRAHEQSTEAERSHARRERLLWDLVERVESFVVQREACGLRDSRHALAYYGVPKEAVARVGARRPARMSV
ncbi:MAG TPA: DUF6665 family protein [Gammaproteobacteria bacterium]|nr:DUF6665 family protein [Gammaproteobacteria bacterium]